MILYYIFIYMNQQRYEGHYKIKSSKLYRRRGKNKLEEWNENYMNVIKEHLNPNFKLKWEKR